MFGLGFQELILFGVVAVLLFGKRLPEVAKSVGASYRDFRKGLSEIQSEMDFTSAVYNRQTPNTAAVPPSPSDDPDDLDEPTAPKLELPELPHNNESAS